ncbi:hypothetical protein MWH06_05550 [Wolbachia pipientis]|nr:hypothetical protein MWH06_05550 [Wolbachia pipientis]
MDTYRGFKFSFEYGIQPNYEPKGKLEAEVIKILPNKHTFNVCGSDLKVEVFYKHLRGLKERVHLNALGCCDDNRLSEIQKVIDDTFKKCSEYYDISSNEQANFRIFIFEDKSQLSKIFKELNCSIAELGNFAGFTTDTNLDGDESLSNSDVFLCKEKGDAGWFFKHYFFDEALDRAISREFTHCIQFLKGTLPTMHLPFVEGYAEFTACEAVSNGVNVDICEELTKCGIEEIKSKNLSLYDIYYGHSKSPQLDSPCETGTVLLKFLSDAYPEIISE